jgi:hypothetical protein
MTTWKVSRSRKAARPRRISPPTVAETERRVDAAKAALLASLEGVQPAKAAVGSDLSSIPVAALVAAGLVPLSAIQDPEPPARVIPSPIPEANPLQPKPATEPVKASLSDVFAHLTTRIVEEVPALSLDDIEQLRAAASEVSSILSIQGNRAFRDELEGERRRRP